MGEEVKVLPGPLTPVNQAEVVAAVGAQATTTGHDRTRQALAIITIVGMFGYITAVTILNVANKELANVALGFLLGTAGQAIYGFYFGSSVGSQGKDMTIATLSNK